MDKKSLTYSALLLLGLVFVSVLLNRGIIQGLDSNAHVKLNTDQGTYSQGGVIVFTGELEFSLNEVVDIKSVNLKNLSGSSIPLDVALPLIPTSGLFLNIPIANASGTLVVKVDFIGISGGTSTGTTIPGTTIPNGTLPLPGGSDGLKGVTSASKIIFTVKWTPPNDSTALGSYTSQLFVELKDATSTLQSSVVSYKIITGPVVSISGPTTVNEASSSATYIIKVSPVSTSTTVLVEYKTVDGTAVAGQDFTGHATTTKVLNAGQATTSVTVLIINDSNKESDETFSVVLVSTNFGTLDTRPAVTTIIDDDVTVTIDVPISLGFNLVGIPVDFGTTTRYSDIAAQFSAQGGAVTSILAWNASGQQFIPWSASVPTTDNNAVELGQGYFVQVSIVPTGDVWKVTGTPVTASVPLNLAVGFNLISIPFSSTTYVNSTLASAISSAGGAVTSILAWDASGQQFIPWSASVPNTDDNPVDTTGKAGYFIQTSTGASNFTP